MFLFFRKLGSRKTPTQTRRRSKHAPKKGEGVWRNLGSSSGNFCFKRRLFRGTFFRFSSHLCRKKGNEIGTGTPTLKNPLLCGYVCPSFLLFIHSLSFCLSVRLWLFVSLTVCLFVSECVSLWLSLWLLAASLYFWLAYLVSPTWRRLDRFLIFFRLSSKVWKANAESFATSWRRRPRRSC